MRARRLGGDAGAATTELVIVAPVLMSMILLIIQFGIYFHASNVAGAAAQEGAGSAAVLATDDNGARLAHGQSEANEFIDVMAGNLLTNPSVEPSLVDGGEAVRISVTAEVVDIFAVPGVDMDLLVTETAENVIEDFRPANEGAPSES